MNIQLYNQTGGTLGVFNSFNKPYGRGHLGQGFGRVFADVSNTQPQDASNENEGTKKKLKGRAKQLNSSENIAPSEGKKPKKKRSAKKAQPKPFVASAEGKAATNAFFGYAKGETPAIASVVSPKSFGAALRLMLNKPLSTSEKYVKPSTDALAPQLDVEDIIIEELPQPIVEIPAPKVPVIVPIKVQNDEPIAPKASLLARLALRITSIAKAIISFPLNALVWGKTSIVYTSTKTIQFCQNIFKFRRNI